MASEFLALATPILASAKIAYDVFKAWRDHTSASERKAGVQKLYLALSATTDYIDSTDNLTANRDSEMERRLDRMWNNAAEALAPINIRLAERLYLKADYWRNPDRFKTSKTAQAQLDEAKITLKDIRKEMLAFL